MKLQMIEESPMRCFRLSFSNNTYDVFIPDVTDLSSCVNITDENGDQVPFDKWDEILEFLNNKPSN